MMKARLLALIFLTLLAPLLGCDSEPEDEAGIKALVEGSVRAVNAADQDAQWSALCRSLQESIGEANYRASQTALYAAGNVSAKNLRFESIDARAGRVRYSVDATGYGLARHYVETYSVAREDGVWCFKEVLSRE